MTSQPTALHLEHDLTSGASSRSSASWWWTAVRHENVGWVSASSSLRASLWSLFLCKPRIKNRTTFKNKENQAWMKQEILKHFNLFLWSCKVTGGFTSIWIPSKSVSSWRNVPLLVHVCDFIDEEKELQDLITTQLGFLLY